MSNKESIGRVSQGIRKATEKLFNDVSVSAFKKCTIFISQAHKFESERNHSMSPPINHNVIAKCDNGRYD